MDRHDPCSGLIDSGVDTAVIVEDPVSGYKEVMFTPEAEAELVDWLINEIWMAEDDAAPVNKRIAHLRETYEATGTNDEILTLPMFKRDARQVIAWLVNKIWEKDPIITCRAYTTETFRIPSQLPGGLVMFDEISADEMANKLEKLAEFKFRNRLPFRKILTDVVTETVIGASPAWIMITYDPEEGTVSEPVYEQVMGPLHRLASIEDRRIIDSEPVRMDVVRAEDMIMPADETDPQKAMWLARKIPMDAMTLRARFGGDYKRIEEGQRPAILGMAKEIEEPGRVRKASTPRRKHDVYEVWPYWPIRVDGELQYVLLCVHLHRDAQKLLMAYINYYAHGERPFVPVFQRQRPHQFTDDSTGNMSAPWQNFLTRLFTIETRNAAQSALKAFLVRRGSTAAKWLEKNKEIKPGSRILYDAPGEIEPFQLGSTQSNTLMPLIEWGSMESSKSAAVSDFSAGRTLPSRTPTGTMSQALDQALTQPAMDLESYREGFATAFRMYFQTVQQFATKPEVVRGLGPDGEAIRQVITLPVEAIRSQFGFVFTATPDGFTKMQEFERTVAETEFIDNDNVIMDKQLQIMMSPEVFGPYERAIKKMIIRKQKSLGRQFELSGKDPKVYTFTEGEIDQMLKEKQELLMQRQMAEQQAAADPMMAAGGEMPPEQMMEGMNATQGFAPDAAGGGAVPAPDDGSGAME